MLECFIVQDVEFETVQIICTFAGGRVGHLWLSSGRIEYYSAGKQNAQHLGQYDSTLDLDDLIGVGLVYIEEHVDDVNYEKLQIKVL